VKAIDVGRHLTITLIDRCVLVDWRKLERGQRWRLAIGPRPLWTPLEMPPRRTADVLGLVFAWYPKGYER
jgi:hypothetical protein